MTTSLLDSLRSEATSAPASGIVELSKYARAAGDVIQLWVGEGDTPTPAFICEAATRSLAAGETTYTWQRGIPELRQAIATYASNLYGRPLGADRFFVCGSGMQAIQIAMTMAAGPGDEVLIPSPVWPNAPAAAGLRGATPVYVTLDHGNRGWQINLDKFAAAITPKTKAIFVNTPSNPTGWTATEEELVAILDLARKHGLWIIADEIYTRFVWTAGNPKRAPSFHDIRQDGDRIIWVNTFSKNWAMTGWRMGWVECDPSLGDVVENLIQYSTSGSPIFIQRAGIAALERGESFVEHQITKARKARDTISEAIEASGRCHFSRPDGAFYIFFGVDGMTDSMAGAMKLVDLAKIGLAPGAAFGPGGEGHLRLCYLRSQGEIEIAAERLLTALKAF
jgi:aspartate/methionine/tyrosine aminotransferase